MSTAMWKAIAEFARRGEAQGRPRRVVIRGDGERVFSAGAEITDDAARSRANARAYDDLVENRCRR